MKIYFLSSIDEIEIRSDRVILIDGCYTVTFCSLCYITEITMDDFSNNRKYALAWLLLAVLFAFALQINVIVRQGAVPGSAVESLSLIHI